MSILSFLLLGCPSAPPCEGADCKTTVTDTDTDSDTDADTDADADTDTDTDTDADADSGLALAWFTADAAWTADGVFVSGHVGTEYFPKGVTADFSAAESLCRNVGTFVPDSTITAPCPGCLYNYQLIVADTTPTGTFCEQFGIDDGEWDGNPGFVFSPTTVYNYETYQFELVPNLWYYNRTELEWLKVTSSVVSTPTSITTYGARSATYYYYYP